MGKQEMKKERGLIRATYRGEEGQIRLVAASPSGSGVNKTTSKFQTDRRFKVVP
jgi:hypothetical protein